MTALCKSYLTKKDVVVLSYLNDKAKQFEAGSLASELKFEEERKVKIEELAVLGKKPVIFCSWDHARLPDVFGKEFDLVGKEALPMVQHIVRYPSDVVFFMHIVLYTCTSLPSAICFFANTTLIHEMLHVAMQVYFAGPYTLMLHICIHQKGVLRRKYSFLDSLWTYLLGPLMVHTWNSYYYDHVKHHHVEGNGPDDLSSTIRYQRDNIWHFLAYLCRFLFHVWYELPFYFIKKKRYLIACKTIFWELLTLTCIFLAFQKNSQAETFVFLLPLLILRIGLVIGNYGQHALVDEVDRVSDYRSSITLIDVSVSPVQMF